MPQVICIFYFPPLGTALEPSHQAVRKPKEPHEEPKWAGALRLPVLMSWMTTSTTLPVSHPGNDPELRHPS